MSKRCLIIGCSRTKVDQLALMPAIERYDGPAFKVVRRFLNESTSTDLLDIFILSAQYQLISGQMPIPFYDYQMTVDRANSLRSQILTKIQTEIAPREYSGIFLSMSKVYLEATRGIELILPKKTSIIISAGSQGQKLTELKAWLWQVKIIQSKESNPLDVAIASDLPRTVILRGQKVELTHDETLARLQQAICQNPVKAFKIRRWYVDIAGQKVSPKWAAKHLFTLPVNCFSAGEARRVLRRLGLKCYPLEAN